MRVMYTYMRLLVIVLLLKGTITMAIESITAVSTNAAPKGPYSQAVRAGNYLFISGQIALDPAAGIVVGETAAEQTEQVLRNIAAILQTAGLTFEHVVKAEVYLKDMNDFQAMNQVYAHYFSHTVKPARQAMQVAKLPLDVRVEISCIAFIP
jgi:2-iminobutanoate/2-iminopropanoate deaminase